MAQLIGKQIQALEPFASECSLHYRLSWREQYLGG